MSQLSQRLPTLVRLALGFVFLVFGLNGFFHFLPLPPVGPRGDAFLGALAATRYMFPLIKGTEVLGALLLLSNRFVALALVLLAPIIVNIVAFHTLLAPFNAIVAIVLGAELYLAWAYRNSYASVLRRDAHPASAPASAAAPAFARA